MELNINEIQKIEKRIDKDIILFFDMDGTLIDTNLANFLSYKQAILSITKSDQHLIFNPDQRFNRSNLKITVPNLTDAEYVKIIQEKEKLYDDFLSETKLIENVAEILIKYAETNMTVLVTNCRKERAVKTLEHFGLLEKFSHKFYREFAGNSEKTNKYLNPISKLGIQSSLIIAFEDEESEIADAQKAGISIVNPIF
jgi:phosphoglycolate phosphatase-like HAD superfamily hydrolase